MTWPPETWGQLPIGTVIINNDYEYIVTDDNNPIGREEPGRMQLLRPQNDRYYWTSRDRRTALSAGYHFISPHPEIEEDPF